MPETTGKVGNRIMGFRNWKIAILAMALTGGPLAALHAQTPPAQAPAARPAAKIEAPAAQPAGKESSAGEEKKFTVGGGSQTCFCKISSDNLQGANNATHVCNDLTSNVGVHYNAGQTPLAQDKREADCSTKCSTAAAQYAQPGPLKQAVAACACGNGAPNGANIYAWSAVGTGPYKTSAPIIAPLHRTAAVVQTKCPAGWLANMTNVDGGVTADGKCKKYSGPLGVTPVPPNGTALGTYGFSWGNGVYAWGTTANGGAAVTTTISAATCGL
jgi:hypothetical protein